MKKIAFIGLGNMGKGMALRLAEAGHHVSVFNRTRAKAEALGDAVQIAGSPRAAAESADAIFAMLADDDASIEVWNGDKGIFGGELKPDALVVECSTLSHDWIIDWADQARKHNLRPVDCPVTGLPDEAASGDLTLLVGASANDLTQARPLLEHISNNIVHFGEVGAGTAYKLMINLMGAVQISAAAEGLLIAEKAGLDLDQVFETLKTGQAASPQVLRNAARMVAGGHDTNITFSGVLRIKDARYALRFADTLGVESLLGKAALESYEVLVDQGDEHQNESKLLDVLRAANKN